MKSPRLGVNIDHVATIRNARGESYPSPLRAALLAQKFGAHSITIHLREDRRHIRDLDLKDIRRKLKIPLNLEMAPTKEMLNISLKYKPKYVCIVPEKRAELTTEGGLNLKKNLKSIKKIIKKLKKQNIRTSLFIEPSIRDIKIAKIIQADCIEIHTGKICNLYNKKKNIKNEIKKIKKAVNYANHIGLEVHAGHGITFSSAKILSKIKGIREFNIGHFLIGESIFIGIRDSIKKFKKILNK
tara:strand:- start:392 stop:1117 length:726 start_codon:yes stop_codon:yes gene_type:complete